MGRYLALVTLLLLGAACGSLARSGGRDFQKSSFLLPEDGVRNNNGPIGPFCCTGRTVTVRNRKGLAVGYVYYFSWRGQAYNADKRFMFPTMEVQVAGVENLSDPASKLAKSEVLIPSTPDSLAREFTVSAGALRYRMSLVKAELTTGPHGANYFFSDPLVLSLKVETPASTP